MAETKQTTAPTTANRDRRSELIRFLKRRTLLLAIFMLPLIAILTWALIVSTIRGALGHETVSAVVAMVVVLALAFLLFVVVEVVLPGLQMWFGWDEWIQRLQTKRWEKRLSALPDAQKAPFQTEQRCNLRRHVQ